MKIIPVINALRGPIYSRKQTIVQWPRKVLRRCVHRTQVNVDKFAYKNSEMRTDEIKERMAHFKSTSTMHHETI